MKFNLRSRSTWWSIIFLGVSFMAWASAGYIESAALSQPHSPTATYSEPMQVKGLTRYVTPLQSRWHDWAWNVFIAAIAVGFIGSAAQSGLGRKRP